MKNITIGLADSSWRTAAAACYYAERGDGEEYAFGATPVDALTKLEKREAAVSHKFDESLAEEVAFLALGAANVLQQHQGESLDSFGGYLGFMNDVIHHAPLLTERWKRMNADQFSGVWPYDVTEEFGRLLAEEMFNHTGATPSDLLESIIANVFEN
jgi:hypothetical protein